jgi:transcriptional regulator with XRE-family HTH domain
MKASPPSAPKKRALKKPAPLELSTLEKIGGRVRTLREERGLSQEGLATLAGTAPERISRIEAGKLNIILTTLEALAKALDLEMLDLVNVDDTPRGRLVELTRHRSEADVRAMIRRIQQMAFEGVRPARPSGGPRIAKTRV